MTFNLRKSNNLGSHHIAIKCQDTENHLINEKAGVKRAGAMLRSPALLFIFAFSPSILYAIKLFEESTLSRWMILIVTGFFLMSVHIGIRAPLSRQPGGRDRTFKRWLPGLVLLLLAISLPTEVLTWRSDGKVADYWMGALITVSNFFTAIFWVGQFVRDTHIVSAPDHRSGKVRMHRTFRKRYGLTAEQANKQLKRVDRLYAFMVGLAIAIPALLTSLSQPHFYGVAYVAIIVICYAVWLGRLERLRLGTVTRALPKADLLAVGLLIVTALLLACGTGLTRAYALHSDMKRPGFSSDRFLEEDWIMPRKFSDEFKDKAVRLAEELVELEGCSKWAAAEEIGEKLGVSAHTLNNWLKPVKASPDV